MFSVDSKIHCTLFRKKKFEDKNIYCKEGIPRILDNSLEKMAYVISKVPLYYEDVMCALLN